MLSLILLASMACDPNVDGVVMQGGFRSFSNYNGFAAQAGPSCGNQSFGNVGYGAGIGYRNQSFGNVGYGGFRQGIVVVPVHNFVFQGRGFRNGFRHATVGFAHLR